MKKFYMIFYFEHGNEMNRFFFVSFAVITDSTYFRCPKAEEDFTTGKYYHNELMTSGCNLQ
jgi:hypothetical protein